MSFLVKIGCQIIMPPCLGNTSAVCNKVSLPVPYDIKVTASLAVLTRSQVRPPVLVPDVASPDVAEDESEAAAEAATEIEHIPDSDLTEFQQKCIAGYAKDPYFSDELKLSHLNKLKGLRWSHTDKLVIPDAFDLRQFVVCEMHDSPYRGHVGVKKTQKAIELLYFWPTLAADVECYVKHCPSCQKMKSTNQKPAGLLQPSPIPSRRWAASVLWTSSQLFLKHSLVTLPLLHLLIG